MAAVESLVNHERASARPPEASKQPRVDDLQDGYRKAAAEYRRDDEIEVRTDHHCWIWKTLADLSSSFEREISTLDAGCGTGRHFHCLKNVKRLVGLDLSPEMLRAARVPIRTELIFAKEVELICGDVHKVTFPPRSFDLIYSLGMFGYGCELTVEVLNKFHDWLSPGGILLIDVSDSSGVLRSVRFRAALRKFAYPILPAVAQKRIDKRRQGVPFSPLSRKDLARLLRQSAFPDWEIYRRPYHSPCWSVDKLECIAARGQLSAELVETFRVRSSAPA